MTDLETVLSPLSISNPCMLSLCFLEIILFLYANCIAVLTTAESNSTPIGNIILFALFLKVILSIMYGAVVLSGILKCLIGLHLKSAFFII